MIYLKVFVQLTCKQCQSKDPNPQILCDAVSLPISIFLPDIWMVQIPPYPTQQLTSIYSWIDESYKLTGFHRGSPWFTCSFSWCKVIYGSFIQAVTYLGDWNSSCTREMNPARNFDHGTRVGGLSQLGFSETIKTVERQWPPTNCYMYWKNMSP